MVANSGSYHNIIRHIVLLISQFSDIVQKSLCTSDGAMVPTFQMNEPFSMFVARKIKQKLWHKFSEVFLNTLYVSYYNQHVKSM